MMTFTKAIAATLAAILAAGTAAGCDAEEILNYLTTWSSIDQLFVTRWQDRPLLVGLDVDTATVSPLKLLDVGGDFRRNAYSQVVSFDGRTIVVLPDGTAAGGVAYDVDLKKSTIAKAAALADARYLTPVTRGLVGVGSGDNSPVARSYDASLHPGQARSLPFLPAYANSDRNDDILCYADSDGEHQSFATYRPTSGKLTSAVVNAAGNLTGVACSANRIAAAIGDLPADAVGKATTDVLVSRPEKPSNTLLVSPKVGSSGEIVFDGELVLTDVPDQADRKLLALDWSDGRVVHEVAMPGIGDVEAILHVSDSIVVVGADALYAVDKSGWSAQQIRFPGEGLPLNIQGAAVTK
jgi:hypothetical protein